jgi:hypothetical protein
MAQGVHSVLLLGEGKEAARTQRAIMMSIYLSTKASRALTMPEVNVMMVLKLQLLLLQDTRQGV